MTMRPDRSLQDTRESVHDKLAALLARAVDHNGIPIPEPEPAEPAPEAIDAEPAQPRRPLPDPSQGIQGSAIRPAATPLDRIIQQIRNHPSERH
jgi:hypothetical protein